jgi:hypothetical protein
VAEERPIISAPDIQILFANVRSILAVNAELLRRLEYNLFNDDSTANQLSRAISAAFERMMPFFRIYTEVRLWCEIQGTSWFHLGALTQN